MIRSLLIALAVTALACGCGGDTVEGPIPKAPEQMTLTSPAFADGDTIPKRFSCDGDELSPPLAIGGVPSAAKSLALLVEDPDAPSGSFVHWTLYEIPPGTRGLAAGQVPQGTREGTNSSGDRGYAGPCPPGGDEPHRYVFALYALESGLGLDAGASPGEVADAITGRAIARGRLTGRFGR